MKSSCACLGLDPMDVVNGMEAMKQTWSEDNQAVFHGSVCRSKN